jgi:2-oxoisovalerate dehydrogenase E1 component
VSLAKGLGANVSRKTLLTTDVPWTQIEVTSDDWDAVAPKILGTLFAQAQLIRAFEEFALQAGSEGLINGPVHSSVGQEGAAAAAVLSLQSGDTINGSHRAHHQFLAKGLSYICPEGIEPREDLPQAVREFVLRTFAEIAGLERGFGHGRGGSMHLRWPEAGATGTNAIVGGGVPLAAGSALAHKLAHSGNVAVTFFGDGAMNIGSTLETMNLAAAWKLPLVFFVENNQYAVSTSVAESTGEPRLAARGQGFGIPSWKTDGMDAVAVLLATQEAVEHARAGLGPAIVEVDVYRYFHQNGPLPGSAYRYRSKSEEDEWRERDPVAALAGHLVRRGLLTQEQTELFAKQTQELMAWVGDTVFQPVAGGKAGQREVREDEWPSTEFVNEQIRSDLAEFATARFSESEAPDGEVEEVRFIDAVARVMGRRMELDPTIVVMGEDVHHLNGGTNGATRGLAERFPERLLGTPICENAFTGMAGGLAIDGRFRPVVEFMYADFMWVAADQLFNQIGKARHMFGLNDPVPLVLRTKCALGTGYGSQHSIEPTGAFMMSPGWRIVAPSNPSDYIGLMNSALTCNDPVVVIEHAELYTQSGLIPIGDLDYCLPVGKAAVRRSGIDVTVLTWLAMTNHVLAVAEGLEGVDTEVIDMRWLDRASVDWETIGTSIRKTNRVLIAEQGALGTSYGGWLSDEIQRRFFDHLDQPVQRITGGEASPTVSRVLEQAAIPQDDEIARRLVEIANS